MIIPEGGGRPISLDSAVRMRLLAMADSLQKNPTIDPLRLPSWTFTRDGKTYGLDAQGMHFGTFTVPTAVLAFLPLPQGNIDQARANAALMAMRADLLRHGREETVHQRPQLLGRQGLGDACEVAHVAEHHRKLAVLGLHGVALRVARHLPHEFGRHVGAEQAGQRAAPSAFDHVAPAGGDGIHQRREQ